MSVTSSLMDQRARVYTLSPPSSTKAGSAVSLYSFTGEHWCRCETPTGGAAYIAAQRGEKLDAVIHFSDDVTLDTKGLVKVDGHAYVITAIEHKRLIPRFVCRAVFADNQRLAFSDAPVVKIGVQPPFIRLAHGTAALAAATVVLRDEFGLPLTNRVLKLSWTSGIASASPRGMLIDVTAGGIAAASQSVTIRADSASFVLGVTVT